MAPGGSLTSSYTTETYSYVVRWEKSQFNYIYIYIYNCRPQADDVVDSNDEMIMMVKKMMIIIRFLILSCWYNVSKANHTDNKNIRENTQTTYETHRRKIMRNHI